ncbi:MAG: hypothetical protein K2P57_13405 [Burkholderiales bacterium]|nr:hypothetical protein [Burkholderiales bacterium]
MKTFTLLSSLGMLACVWHMSALAGESPYREPPAEGPYLVGLDMRPIHLPIHVKTLCRNEELIAFSCTLQNKKIVSLCASSDIGKDSGYLQYRYGKDSSSVELEYPKKKVYPHSYFKQAGQQAQLGSASAISFRVGSYRYSLFLTETRWDSAISGVVVDRGGKLVKFNQCVNKSILLTFNPGSTISGFGFPSLPPAGDDVSYAQLESVAAAGLKGVHAIQIGRQSQPTDLRSRQPDSPQEHENDPNFTK